MEVLAALAIISVALYTVTQAHVTSIKGLRYSNNITVAASYVSDMVERIKANKEGALLDYYKYSSSSSNVLSSQDGCEGGGGCGSKGLAEYDLENWVAAMPKSLLRAQAEVTAVDVVDDTIKVSVFWDNDNSGSTGTENCPPKSDADKDCYSLTVSL